MSIKKLTPALLRKIIEEEVKTAAVATDAVETDADELADSLEKHIDFVKALKIEETRIVQRLAKIREAKSIAIKRIAKKMI